MHFIKWAFSLTLLSSRTWKARTFGVSTVASSTERNQVPETVCKAALSESSHREENNRHDDSFQLSSSASSLESYHLIWSRGAWKKIVLGTGSLFLANTLYSLLGGGGDLFQSAFKWMSQSHLSPLASFTSNVVLPLFASACCLIQLLINLLAGGCAGFNTVLGPARPYFLSLLLYLSIKTHEYSRHWYLVSALRWSVALLPEALDLWNRYQERPKKQFSTEMGKFTANVQLEIPTMGCVACINNIDSAIQHSAPGQILEASSFLNPLGAKGGRARVRLVAQSRQEIDQLVQALVESVEKAGFEPCRIESVVMDKQ